MTKSLLFISLITLAGACAGGSNDSSAGASCADVASHVVELRRNERAMRNAAMSEEAVARERTAAAELCEAQHLAANVRDCLLTAADRDGVTACVNTELR